MLHMQGRLTAALAKYDEALTYTSSWAALKEARETVTKFWRTATGAWRREPLGFV